MAPWSIHVREALGVGWKAVVHVGHLQGAIEDGVVTLQAHHQPDNKKVQAVNGLPPVHPSGRAAQ